MSYYSNIFEYKITHMFAIQTLISCGFKLMAEPSYLHCTILHKFSQGWKLVSVSRSPEMWRSYFINTALHGASKMQGCIHLSLFFFFFFWHRQKSESTLCPSLIVKKKKKKVASERTLSLLCTCRWVWISLTHRVRSDIWPQDTFDPHSHHRGPVMIHEVSKGHRLPWAN